MKDLIEKLDLADFGNIFRRDPAEIEDQELLSLDYLLHRAWRHKRDGGRVHLGEKSWSFEDIINLHARVKREMSKRGFKHPLQDELDQQTEALLREPEAAKQDLAPVGPSGVELGEEITLEDILPYFKGFKLRKPYVLLVGGLVTRGRTRGDIDILIKETPDLPMEMRKVLEWRILRALPEKYRSRVSFNYDQFHGPITDFVELYDLTFERVNPENEVKRMSMPEPEAGDAVKQLRSAGADVIRQAEASAKKGKVRLMRFFLPPKPTRGHKPDEAQSVQTFLRGFKSEDYPVYASKKYDGGNYEIHRDGDRIVMWSEDGRDNVDRFPKIAEAFLSLPVDCFVVLAEIERWEDGRHLPRESVIAYINEASEPDDSDFVANVYDIAFFESGTLKPGDIHDLSFEDRLKYLDALEIPQSTEETPELELALNKVPHIKCRTSEDLRKETERLRRIPGSEGNVATSHKQTMPLGGEASSMVKFHNAAMLVGVVIEKNETKTPKVFNYVYGLDFQNMKVPHGTIKSVGGRMYHEVGKTFSTALDLDPGDTVKVEFETLNLTREGDTVAVTAWAPRVLGVSDRKRPFTIGEAVKEAKANFVFQEKEITPEGETIFKGDLIEKAQSPFKSPGGKARLYKTIIGMMPEHETYVEAFAGAAHVFLHKRGCAVSVLNDGNPEIAFAWKFLRDMTDADLEWLRSQNWRITPAGRDRAFDMKPKSDRQRFYRFAYLNKSTFWGHVDHKQGHAAGSRGQVTRVVDKLAATKEKLRNAKVRSGDWKKVVAEFDGPKTLFYLDPPYPSHWPDSNRYGYEESDLVKTLKKIKGRFIVSYEPEKAKMLADAGFHVKRVRTLWTGSHSSGGPRVKYEIVATNFPVHENEDWLEKSMEIELGVRQAFGSYAGKKGLASRIASHIPYHRTYVEPFAGGAAVFWRKDPSPVEVLNDRDQEIAFMYRFIRDHTPEDRAALAKRDWVIRRSTHERLKQLKPQSDRDRFYKSFYLTRSSYGKQRGGSFNPANEGVRIDFERNITGAYPVY